MEAVGARFIRLRRGSLVLEEVDCERRFTDTVTAEGNVLVAPWSALLEGAFTAPATSVVSCAGLRPLSGSSIIRAESTTCRIVDVVVST